MKWVSAIVSFVIVFILAFFLGGLFLMPYLPPIPDRTLSAFEIEFWTDNWAGALLGLILGCISASTILKKHKKLKTGKII